MTAFYSAHNIFIVVEIICIEKQKYLLMCACTHAYASANRGLKRVLGSLELELLEVVSCSTLVLGPDF